MARISPETMIKLIGCDARKLEVLYEETMGDATDVPKTIEIKTVRFLGVANEYKEYWGFFAEYRIFCKFQAPGTIHEQSRMANLIFSVSDEEMRLLEIKF